MTSYFLGTCGLAGAQTLSPNRKKYSDQIEMWLETILSINPVSLYSQTKVGDT